MPRRQQSLQHRAEEQRSAAVHASARFVDYQLDWNDLRGQRIARFGGRFDKRTREYVGDAPVSRVIQLHDGQLAAAHWFREWLAEHLGVVQRNGPPTYQALFAGGRRGGKTNFMSAAVCAYVTAVPDSKGWLVAPSDSFYEELIGYVEDTWPKWWYQSLGWPHWTFFLGNGSKLTLRSGFTPRKLKKGRADIIGVNEAQQIKEQSLATLSGSIVDVGGLVMSAANPPDVGDEGTWVADFAHECERGIRNHARYFFFNPRDNPFIEQEALEALRETMSEHEYRIQVLGEFLLPPDAVLYAWDRVSNEMPVPRIAVDVTDEFTRHFEGRGFADIVSVDVQNFPWISAVRWRAIRNPDYPNDITQAFLWGVGEVFEEQGDEVDVANELKAIGCDPERTLVICDASCDWQQQKRKEELQRAKYRGKGSMDIFRGEGFRWVVPPDRYMDANPDVADRCRAANARICTASGRRLVFLDPDKCDKTCGSIRHWKTVNGKPSRHSKYAHGGDAVSYCIWRFFPRRRKAGNLSAETVTKRTRGDRGMRGF